MSARPVRELCLPNGRANGSRRMARRRSALRSCWPSCGAVAGGAHRRATSRRSCITQHGSLAALASADLLELTAIPGIGAARGRSCVAAFEIGRRSLLIRQHCALDHPGAARRSRTADARHGRTRTGGTARAAAQRQERGAPPDDRLPGATCRLRWCVSRSCSVTRSAATLRASSSSTTIRPATRSRRLTTST